MQGEILYNLACHSGRDIQPRHAEPSDTAASWSWVVLVAIPPNQRKLEMYLNAKCKQPVIKRKKKKEQ